MVIILGMVFNSQRLLAQTFSVLHAFTADNVSSTNLDGAYPQAGLVLAGNTLYGTASAGGTNKLGTVFSIATDGSAFAVLHTFAGTNLVNAEGAAPKGTLAFSGNILYGAASDGGTNDSGTLFSIATDGSGFTVLHTFATNAFNAELQETNADGAYPNSLTLASDGTLYGTANEGGTNGYGTIFSINTNGTGFTVLHAFDVLDGENPQGGLLLWGGTLYGTARNGGTNRYGAIFSINTSGANFARLHSFSALLNGTNLEGGYPEGGLAQSGDTLYGAASEGGTNGNGTLFSLDTNGENFTVLHTFTPSSGVTNFDGTEPEGTLLLAGNTLYGTAAFGGTNQWGTVFSVNTNGSGFNTLYAFAHVQFATNSGGVEPETGVILSGGTLYGTAHFGGNAYGTVFSLAIVPAIASFNLLGTNLELNATNGVAGETCFVLASADLTLPLSQWTPVTTNVLSTGGNFTITATNAVNLAVPRQFYTLQVQ